MEKIQMASDGVPIFEPTTIMGIISFKILLSLSILSSFLTVFGKDIILIGFPQVNDIELEMFLSCLTGYLFLEFVFCSIGVRGYSFSMYFFLDLMALIAVVLETIQFSGFIHQSRFWIYFEDYIVVKFILFRSHKIASFGARLGKLSKFRFGKILTADSGRSAHGYSEKFGIKGFEDDNNLFQYIHEKFTDAFNDSEEYSKVDRGSFTSMLRDILKLDLELEEEEVIYRVMTAFGRSQEIKSMEDELNADYSKIHFNSTKYWKLMKNTISAGSQMKTKSQRKSSQVVPQPLDGIMVVDEGSSPGSSFSSEYSSKDSTSTDSMRSRHHSLSNSGEQSSEVHRVAGILKSRFMKHSAGAPNIVHFPNKSTPSEKSFAKLNVLLNSANAFWKHEATPSPRTPPKDIENSETLENQASWEVTKPLRVFRMNIATAMLPLESYSMLWGLQMFRKVDKSTVVPQSESFFKQLRSHNKSTETLTSKELDGRLVKTLLIDGNQLYQLLNKLESRRAEMLRNQSKSNLNKRRTSLFGSFLKSNRTSEGESPSSRSNNGSFLIARAESDQNVPTKTEPTSRFSQRAVSEPSGAITKLFPSVQNMPGGKLVDKNQVFETSMDTSDLNSSFSSQKISPKSSETSVSTSIDSHHDLSIDWEKEKVSFSKPSHSNPLQRISSFFKNISRKISRVDISPESTMSDSISYTPVLKIVSPEQKEQMSKDWVMSVVNKVKEQMRAHLKADIIKDSTFGGKEGIAEHIGRGSFRAALIGTLLTLVMTPMIDLNFESCPETRASGMFQALRYQVGSSYIDFDSCELLKADEKIVLTINEFRAREPSPFLIRINGCTLYSNPDLAYYSYSTSNETPHFEHTSSSISLYQIEYLPCNIDSWTASRRETEKFDTVVGIDLRSTQQREATNSVILGCLIIALLMAISVIISRDTTTITDIIVSPLTELARDMDRVSRFDLTQRKRRSTLKNEIIFIDTMPDSNITEVQSIQDSFTTMRTTIQSFAKYVPQDVVQQLVKAKAGIAQLAVEEQEVTILFTDIENFTKICESMGVGNKLLALMSDYFTAMTEIITSTGGCLLEFVGDAVLAVWNAPNPEELHAVRAVTAALEMHAYLEGMVKEWDEKGYPRIRIRCGIHTAKVLVGNLGAPNRMKYGVLGDGVNTASRLEETNKRYGTRTLISANTFKEVNRQINNIRNLHHNDVGEIKGSNPKGFFQTRAVDRVILKGKTKATTLYEVVDFMGDKEDTRKSSQLRGLSGSFDGVMLSTTALKLSGEAKVLISTEESPSPKNKVFTLSGFKELMLESYNSGWTSFLARDFKRAFQLFQLVNQMQLEIGPKTQVSGEPNDFGDTFQGDKAAILLRDRCDRFLKEPPPSNWDGTEILTDKHF